MSEPFKFLKLPDYAYGDRRRDVSGELPGVRDTMDSLIRQEVAGGADPQQAAAQVRRVAEQYHQDVASGRDPYPLKR